jgi:DNA-binding transcriptional ArsR family regulator
MIALKRRRNGFLSVTHLAEPFNMSMPAFIKHIRILKKSKLILIGKLGRSSYCSLNNRTVRQAERWLGRL